MVQSSAPIQKTDEAQDTDRYQGDIPGGYFDSSEEVNDSGGGPQDSSGVSSQKRGAAPPASSGTDSPPNDSSNYLDVGADLDGAMEDFLDEIINNDDLYLRNSGGYRIINEELWESYYRRIQGLMNLVLMIAMIADARSENSWMIFETFSDLPPASEQTKTSNLTEGIAKANETFMKLFNKTQVILLQDVQAHNASVYKKKMKKAEKMMDDWYEGVLNWLNLGATERKQLDLQKAVNEGYESVLAQNISSLSPGLSFSGINDGVDAKGDRVFEELSQADNYIQYDKNGYIDLNATKAWIVDLRQRLSGLANYNRLLVSTQADREENQKMIWEVFTEKDSGSSKMKGVESALEQEIAHQTLLFDKFASVILELQGTTNKIHHIDKQIEKWEDSLGLRILGGILSFAALVIGIIGLAMGWGAILLGALVAGLSTGGALSQWGAQQVADSVDDEYVPGGFDSQQAVATIVREARDARARQNEELREADRSVESEVEWLDRKQDELMSEIGYGQISTISDGYYQIEYGELGSLQRQLTGVQNMLRVIQMIRETRSAARRAIFSAFTGLRAGSDSPLIKGMLETTLTQSNVKFQSLSSYLTEIQQAHNWEQQQKIAMERATFALKVSLISAFGSAGLAAGIGAIAGVAGQVVAKVALYTFSITQAIGNALAGYISARWGAGSNGNTSNGVAFDPDVSSIRKETRRSSNGDYLRYLDQESNEIYSEMLDFSKSIISAGDNRVGVNSKHIADLQKRLAMINNLLLVLTSIHETKAKASQAIARSYGASVGSVEGTSELVGSQVEASLNTFATIKRILSEKVEVANRAAQASDEVTSAGWRLAISSVLGATGIALGSFVSTFYFAITSASIALSNAIFDLVNSLNHAKDDYGNFEKYTQENKKSAPREENRRSQDNVEEVLGSLDRQLEELAALDSAYMVEVGGGNWGLNMGMVNQTQLAMEKIFRVVEILNSMQRALPEIIGRISGRPSIASLSALDQTISNIQQTAFAVLETEIDAMQTVVARRNEMNAFTRQAWQAAFRAGIAAISLAITSIKANLNQKLDNINNNIENRVELTPTEQADQLEIQETLDTYAWVSQAVSLSGIISDVVVGEIYDATQEDAGYSEKAAAKNVDKAQSSKNRVEGFGDKLDAVEETITANKLYGSAITLESQAIGIFTEKMDALVQMLGSLGESIGQFTAERIDAAGDENGFYTEIDEAAVAALAPQPQGPDAVTPFSADNEQAPPSTRAYVEALDQLIARREVLMQQETQVTESSTRLAELAAQTENLSLEEIQQIVSQPASGEQIDPQEQLLRLQTRLGELRSEVDRLIGENQRLQGVLPSVLAEVAQIEAGAEQRLRDLMGTSPDEPLTPEQETWLNSALELLGGRVTEIEEQIAQVQARIQELRQEVPELQREIGRLQRQIQDQTDPATSAPAGQEVGAVSRSPLEFIRRFFTSNGGEESSLSPDNSTDVVLAIRHAGNGQSSPQQSYEQAMRDQDVLSGSGSSTGGGYFA